MTTCSANVQNLVNTGEIWNTTRLLPNTSQNILVSPLNNQIFRLEIIQQETVQFTLNLGITSAPSNVGVNISFFEIRGSTPVSLGGVIVSEMNTSFQKDFTPGIYAICIRSNVYTYTGLFTGFFTSYQIYSIFVPRAYAGESVSPVPLEFHIVKKKCTEPLQFEIIDGSLPPGLTFTSAAQIYGVLPNLDCVEDNAALSPSQNWFYPRPLDETWHPWGRQWRFLVRVWIISRPEISTERWFCVRIKNNWSWDRDAFHIPNDTQDPTPTQIPRDTLPVPVDMCCEEPENVLTFIPEPIQTHELCDCEKQDTSEEKIIKDFLRWYTDVIQNQTDKDNPHIQEFIEKFRTSDYYREIIKKAGLEETLYTKRELELISFQKIIESYNNQLKDGRRENDIDSVMLDLQYKENQKLYTTALADTGTHCMIDIKTYDYLYADVNLGTLIISDGSEAFGIVSGLEQVLLGISIAPSGENGYSVLTIVE